MGQDQCTLLAPCCFMCNILSDPSDPVRFATCFCSLKLSKVSGSNSKTFVKFQCNLVVQITDSEQAVITLKITIVDEVSVSNI